MGRLLATRQRFLPRRADRADDHQEAIQPAAATAMTTEPVGPEIAARVENQRFRGLDSMFDERLELGRSTLLDPVGVHLVDQRLDRSRQPIAEWRPGRLRSGTWCGVGVVGHGAFLSVALRGRADVTSGSRAVRLHSVLQIRRSAAAA